MGQQACGRESLGFTKVDQKNYLRTVRQKKIKFGEAGYLIEYFSKKMLENLSFFYEMQLDTEEQITNVFWVDAKMIMDYGIFGDVVMCGNPPQTFFTDQDAAIANDVLHVMSGTCHRLCIWHLMQNAVKKEEDEFLSAWQSTLDEYNAHDDTWVAATFEIRKKWVHAYVKWTWSTGMQTTQLSESFNASLKGYLKSDVQLPEFFTHFIRMIFDKRYKELEAEYDLLFRIVHYKMDVSILIHAREVYTKARFKVFQAQFEESLKSSITKCVSNGEKYIFTVVMDEFFKERLVKREGIVSK
ncbi:protein FAR1-RELATED SEQUENCE 5-like [Asparagus officinalis]|uniref:protein FAR1-RELATED SEQUENCE 5-like n=1 Tax=Asparagus officinalis TaxID=4686 RepID=UPI00098E24F2|nr:protein FAR1-RELATED SEQUENCE 5-like [Asparagus officinalis]